MTDESCVVDNRVFLLGLDGLYREAMKRHEREELLECARAVARTLGLDASDISAEGYYGEDPNLAEYFRLVRTLQSVDKSRAPDVAGCPEYRRLREVASARLFGSPEDSGTLLPTGRDALARALLDTRPDWNVKRLVSAAADRARSSGDYSLVGLASGLKDPVLIAALRESVVLYTKAVTLHLTPELRFEWTVDPDLADQATRFVSEFNSLFDEELPLPGPATAQRYWDSWETNEIVGRCVCLGDTPPRPQVRYYHWGICRSDDGLTVQEFWHATRWTTDRYRTELRENDGRPLPGLGSDVRQP